MPDPNNDPDESIIADLLTQYASEAEVVLKAYIANNMADNPITKQPDVMMYEDKWFKHAKNSMQIVLLHFLDELRPVRTSESGTIHVGRGPFDKVPRAHVRRGAHFAMTMNLQHADFDNPENVALYDSKYKPAVKNGNLFGDEIVVFNTWSNDSVQRTGRLGEALIFDNKYSRSVLGTVNKSDLVGAITDGSGKLNLNNLSDMQKRALKKIATGDMSFDTNRDTGSKNINHRSVYTGLYENDVDKVIDGFLSTNESGLNALTSGWLRSPNSGGYNLVVRLPEGGATIPQYKRKDGSMAEINVDIAERHFNSPLDWVGSLAMEQLLGRRLTAEETSGLLTFLGAN